MQPPPLRAPLPRVIGYLRLPSPRPAYVMAARRRLAWYCQENDLQVGGVFTDAGYSSMTVCRPGFADLCALIREERPHAVLLLHPRDLSTDPAIASHLASRVLAIGVPLLTVRGDLAALAEATP